MPTPNLCLAEITALKNDILKLPFDDLTIELKAALDTMAKCGVVDYKVHIRGSNLFLFNDDHWKIIGDVLKKLCYTQLDLLDCNFDLLLISPEKRQTMNWQAFCSALANTHITHLQIENPDSNMGFFQPVIEYTLTRKAKENAITNAFKQQNSLQDLAAFFIAKEQIIHSRLPPDLVSLVADMSNSIWKTEKSAEEKSRYNFNLLRR